MRLKIVSTTVFAALLLMSAAGCKKAPVPTPPPVQTPPPAVQPVTPPPAPAPVQPVTPPPAPVDSFKVENLDSSLAAVCVPIYFAFDQYNLSRDAIASIEKIAAFLKDKSTLRMLIEGNADERGSSEYNMALGDRRAQAVKSYLVGYGISGDRLEKTSYGKERPAVADCADEACHAKNRRVEWKHLGN